MKWLTSWSFKNKAAVQIIVVMALVVGVLSYLNLPMEFLPEADNPSVTVTAIGPGYDAGSMESQVTAPLEKALSLTKGKREMFSTSGNGYARIDLMFDSKTNMKDAKKEVEQAVSQVQLPERVSPPFVVQFNTSMIPISWLTISFKEGMSAGEVDRAENLIISELQKIKGAGQVELTGKSAPSVTITADPDQLKQRGVPFQALMGVLQGRDLSASVGESTIEGATGNLKVTAKIKDLDMLKKLPVAPGVSLGDVAKVEQANSQESISRVGGKDVMMITVSKGANANAVAVGESVHETAERMNKEIPGAEVTVISSTSESVVHSVNSMMREVLLGALFATIVILLFLRNIRATLVTIVSIPLSLAITLYLLSISGVSLNVITLGGVAVAVGRLVDDSIVVIENIYRRLQKEKFSIQLIKDSTGEVATAITSSTLTTVAVFMPMGLLSGSLQAFLLPFALTVTYSLLASLLVAITVVPLLSAAFLKKTRMKEHQYSPRFTNFLRWNLNHKWLPLVIAGVLFFGSIGIYMSMPKGAIDSSNAENLTVTLEYPDETPTDKVVDEGKKLEKFLVEQNEPKWVSMSYGNSADAAKMGSVVSPTLVSYMIEMKKGENAENLIAKIKQQRDQYPGAELNAGALDFASGASATDVFVDVTGSDAEQLTAASVQVMEQIRSIEHVLKVKSNQEQKKPVFTFEVNPVEAQAQDIAMQLQGMLNPIPIGTLNMDNQISTVVLNPLIQPNTEKDLSGITIMTANGPAPVSSVAKLVKTEEASSYYHKDGKTYLRVTATVDPSQLSLVGAEIDKRMKELTLPGGVTLSVGGASAQQAEDFMDLGITALISIGIIYLIMVITFKTLRAPLAIMFSLPLAAIGAVLGLLISGVTPDFTAMFGALMLIGIVVTNAIVLLDRVKQNEERMSIREALLEAAGSRMRPILMTAIATICAMLPLIFGTSESGSIVSQSLAIVVIGGLSAATLLTLVIVPCIYELLFFRKSRRQRAAGGHDTDHDTAAERGRTSDHDTTAVI
ncbi:efflux RND transporter permease subunit [Paenibacillus eucommiae]|uniref:HAE1 family hydrophobic/amphiphilic exporter-1 n=1 Tax=Paenibacillus eucommiae TaxID=1355755 RepID=A0ABS4J5D7_9BACL|nr:efflux RND transporter permease subunit [Paenibacillus eucommiae]MBP1995047.1 HAE1 family hydrophobic/amphiphilic exporter-1 [Paenibacillus eucommiae]